MDPFPPGGRTLTTKEKFANADSHLHSTTAQCLSVTSAQPAAVVGLPLERLDHQLQMDAVILQVIAIGIVSLQLFSIIEFKMASAPKVPDDTGTKAR